MEKMEFCIIPKAAWGQKLKTVIGDYEWTKLSKKIRTEANFICSYCGDSHPEKYGTHAHEIWEWDLETKTQKLKDVKCVCKKCHDLVHPGHSTKEPATIIKEYSDVNKIELKQAIIEWSLAWSEWKERNRIEEWKLDCSDFIKRYNLNKNDVINF